MTCDVVSNEVRYGEIGSKGGVLLGDGGGSGCGVLFGGGMCIAIIDDKRCCSLLQTA